MSSSSYSPHPNPFTGHVTGSRHQQTAHEVSFPNTFQTQPASYGSYGVAQPWERAQNAQNQSAWAQMPYFDPTQVPLYGHVWPGQAEILPMPNHFHSLGVSPVSLESSPLTSRDHNNTICYCFRVAPGMPVVRTHGRQWAGGRERHRRTKP